MLKSKKVVNSQYDFVRCLGEGLSSTVYEALRSNSSGIKSEQVAVKVLKSENSVSWLQNEFETLRRVNSGYCVRVLGHEAFDEGPALVLEFIEGVTLFELGRAFQLSQQEIGQIGTQVHEGLQAIKLAECTHGDLNPKNILLTRSGDVKLIDFGSFSNADESELIGSLPYIPKQIWLGERASFESDLASWNLIARDLEGQFACLPKDRESARRRACEESAGTFSVVSEQSDDARLSLSVKVQQLLTSRSVYIQTAVLSRDAAKEDRSKSRLTKASAFAMASFVLAVLLPMHNFLSEPLKAAEAPAEPASLLIRTHEWTEVSVNGISKGYSPVNLHNLAPGKYRIKYKRPRGAGELVFLLNPGQKRLLKDADFKD